MPSSSAVLFSPRYTTSIRAENRLAFAIFKLRSGRFFAGMAFAYASDGLPFQIMWRVSIVSVSVRRPHTCPDSSNSISSARQLKRHSPPNARKRSTSPVLIWWLVWSGIYG